MSFFTEHVEDFVRNRRKELWEVDIDMHYFTCIIFSTNTYPNHCNLTMKRLDLHRKRMTATQTVAQCCIAFVY